MPIAALRPFSGAAAPTPVAAGAVPEVSCQIAFATDPLEPPTYTNVSSYLRGIGTTRGRNYEYNRTETGTSAFTLSNRDSRFNPDNTAGPYYPNLKPTRRCRLRATWDATVYDMFVGYTKGYPQEFPDMGFDALVRQRASDYFYALNMLKFRPGTTSLTAAIETAVVSQGGIGEGIPLPEDQEIIAVGSTALPMPQAVPFVITLNLEQMLVTEIVSSTEWRVVRAHNDSVPVNHAIGATVSTATVSFGEQLSGDRVRDALEYVGIPELDTDVSDGISVLSPTGDLAGTNVLEHLQLVAEAENGQLFVSRSGVITFRDRHWALENERSDRATFSDSGTADTISYSLPGPVEHDESKIANVVRITPTSGNTQTSVDQTSIDENFERVLEKQWPLASDNEAKAATEWMLATLKDATVRIPEVTVHGARDPSVWPTLLSMDIGQRYGFVYTPKGGGDPIVRSVIVEGIQHDVLPQQHVLTVRFSPADTTTYWRVGIVGYSELGETTRSTY